MNRTSFLTAIASGALTLLIGAGVTVAIAVSPYGFSPDGMTITLIVLSVLGAVGGALGIAGAICMSRSTPLARKLMLTAAILTMPMGFIFFFMFIIARKKALDPWQEFAA